LLHAPPVKFQTAAPDRRSRIGVYFRRVESWFIRRCGGSETGCNQGKLNRIAVSGSIPMAELKDELSSRKETIGADLPVTRYARSGDLTIAYQIMGDGPIDLVLVPPFMSHVEFLHEIPGYTDCLRRLAEFARVITFDKSGQGLSDRWFGMPTFEQRVDDIAAVMAASASKRAALLSCSEGGPD
jgi:hypothetical protein